ncbi:MAG: amidase domain-containing protein [Merdibacter sp.]
MAKNRSSLLLNQPLSRAASTKTVCYIGDIDVALKQQDYVKKYAKNANPAYKNFMYTGGDCTNFASQIRYGGGLRYAPGGRTIYQAVDQCQRLLSVSYGTKKKSTKWSIFVKKLKPGMFIAADFGGDGALDHVAYVAANGSSSSNKYIAQHSAKAEGFYYARSDSTTSNWDKDSKSRVLWIIGNNGS